MNRPMTVRQVAEVAILLALAMALEAIALFLPKLPMGGSFSLSMLPIFIIAYRHGLKIGLLSGVLYGLLDLMLNGFVLWHPMSLFLDYFFAFGILGVSALVFALKKNSTLYFVLGILVGGTLRYFMHFLAGILLFAGDLQASEQFGSYPVWIGSLLYNGTYMIPSIIATVILGAIIFKRLSTLDGNTLN